MGDGFPVLLFVSVYPHIIESIIARGAETISGTNNNLPLALLLLPMSIPPTPTPRPRPRPGLSRRTHKMPLRALRIRRRCWGRRRKLRSAALGRTHFGRMLVRRSVSVVGNVNGFAGGGGADMLLLSLSVGGGGGGSGGCSVSRHHPLPPRGTTPTPTPMPSLLPNQNQLRTRTRFRTAITTHPRSI
jgi:hypothetical protein